MAISQAQIQVAEAVQDSAAHDVGQQVRVVAGPGTGKSRAIEERVRWLLDNGIDPTAIYCVSFTRASALDLRSRIYSYCNKFGIGQGSQVRVSTLHSLALRTLRAANLLTAFPTEPQVMGGWELEEIFDAEFGLTSQIGKRRREAIRREHEAFWSTGQWNPPNAQTITPAISARERAQFTSFHGPRTQTYACVLAGELVRQCVLQMQAGNLDVVELLGLQHLVVDEYQDLNPMDLEFVDQVASSGSTVFVAGDDDQSVYSFRFAEPSGIQNFVVKYPGAGQHELAHCFRCTSSILTMAQTLIAAFPQPNRIPKTHVSLYASSLPPVAGHTDRWVFDNADAEAKAVAESCRDLIAAGIDPKEILVLLSNQRQLLPRLKSELQTANVPFEPPRSEGFADSDPGRCVLAITRLVCSTDDYVAYRMLLGLLRRVGIGTANAITEKVIGNNLNYRAIYHDPLPQGVFSAREITALHRVRLICQQLGTWSKTDTVGERSTDIAGLLQLERSASDAQEWQGFAATLPQEMTLEELRDLIGADSDDQQELVLQGVATRLGQAVPEEGMLESRVRVMTMHGAKGLSAKVVFIPGLEEEIIPGPWRRPFPGLVLEAARLLYVSITRARAACIVSRARFRVVHGNFVQQTPSRYAAHLSGPFAVRNGGLTAPEVARICSDISNL